MKLVVFSTHLKERTNMYFIKTQCKLRFFEIRKHSISGPFEGRLVFKWFGFGMVGLLALDQSGIQSPTLVHKTADVGHLRVKLNLCHGKVPKLV